MSRSADTARLSPEERLGEIAAILAAGLLRLNQRAALVIGELGENLDNLRPDGLAIPPETRLSVRVG
jgi:hypothetical protein